MILFSLALAALQTPPAQSPDERSRSCQVLVRTAPQQALETATAWLAEQGGLPARQCLGLAYVGLQQWEAAATVYESAAAEAERAGDPSRDGFRAQAGNAWLAAGQYPRAMQALDAALATQGLDDQLRGEMQLDRARVLVAMNEPVRARADLDRALALIPAAPFAWYLSAALALRQNDPIRAARDVARAHELAPDNPDILLLAGTIAGQAGNMEEAERLYRRAAEEAPDSDAGRQARESLATMREVEVPAPTPPPQPQLR